MMNPKPGEKLYMGVLGNGSGVAVNVYTVHEPPEGRRPYGISESEWATRGEFVWVTRDWDGRKFGGVRLAKLEEWGMRATYSEALKLVREKVVDRLEKAQAAIDTIDKLLEQGEPK